MNCPPLNELLDYQRQLLAPPAAARVATHLATACRACAENIEWLSQVAASSAAHPSFEFPIDTLQGMTAWFRSQPAHESRSPLQQLVRQLIPKLLFDSFAQTEWALVRGSATGEAAAERQMLFQAEGYDIDLHFESAADPRLEDLLGQVSPHSAATTLNQVTVELRSGAQAPRRAAADAQGYFKFAQIPRGTYDLKIFVPEGEISIAQLTH